jgi:hypothetical protein
VLPRRPERLVRSSAGKLAVLAGCFVPAGLVAVAVVWAAYGFHSPLARDAAVNAAFDWSRIQPPGAIVRGLFALVRRLQILPDAWTYGFLHFLDHATTRPAFLLGEHSETGWRHYFRVTFGLKTPVPLLLLTAAAAVFAVRAREGRRAWFVWVPFVVYFLMAVSRSINIGHRHLLPVYPFVFVAGGCAAAALWKAAGRWRVPARVAVAALLGWYAAGTLLKLLYFGTADPGYYGIACDRLPGYQPPPPSTLVREVRPGDIVAVSATHLQGIYLEPGVRALAEQAGAARSP